ncbi:MULTISPECIES: NACHT C-terminal helical domain 2-containing protein [Nostocales]|uniref:NACHT C-terminal helical domain 2-containing protein n=1 Tax=Nostocales TaxID=1161 RepID=UPI0038B63FE6
MRGKKNRSIARHWLLSHSQKELLHQYYDVNKLLVNCLNSGCWICASLTLMRSTPHGIKGLN